MFHETSGREDFGPLPEHHDHTVHIQLAAPDGGSTSIKLAEETTLKKLQAQLPAAWLGGGDEEDDEGELHGMDRDALLECAQQEQHIAKRRRSANLAQQ